MQCMSGTFRNCCTDNGRFSESCDAGADLTQDQKNINDEYLM